MGATSDHPVVARVRPLPWAIALGLAWWGLYRSLEPMSRWLTHHAMGLPADSHLGQAVAFFIYETPKVLLLLTIVVFVVGMIRSFFTPERTRALLAGRRESVGNVLAAGLGVATPFCSCSAVPLFIGFVSAGVPLGVTLSFLIAAPMVNEIALGLLLSLFGWKIAAIYLGTGLTIAIVAGWVIGRMKMERFIEDWVRAAPVAPSPGVTDQPTPRSGAPSSGDEMTPTPGTAWADRLADGRAAVVDIVGRVWIFVVLGIAVGAGIHGYVPQDFLAAVMGRGAWWSVPVAVVLGVPMYSNAAGIVPVVQALVAKGAALGTVLAFMMSVIALSLPEAILLRKVLRPTLLATFFAVVATGILATGYLFNAIL